MDLKGYWEARAGEGSWSTRRLYEGSVGAHNYNFVTRREGVRELLASQGRIQRVLDVGCGTGDYFEIAALHGATYHGVDYARNMVRAAADRVDGHGTRHLVSVGAGAELPYRDHSFDLVLAIGYIEYFPEPAATLREIARVLKPGGTLVMQSYKPDVFCTLNRVFLRVRRRYRTLMKYTKLGGGGLRVTHYTRRGLNELLAPFGFQPIEGRFNNHWILPKTLLMKYPGLYVRVSERLNQWNSPWCGVLAVNYIGKYVSTAPGAHEGSGAR